MWCLLPHSVHHNTVNICVDDCDHPTVDVRFIRVFALSIGFLMQYARREGISALIQCSLPFSTSISESAFYSALQTFCEYSSLSIHWDLARFVEPTSTSTTAASVSASALIATQEARPTLVSPHSLPAHLEQLCANWPHHLPQSRCPKFTHPIARRFVSTPEFLHRCATLALSCVAPSHLLVRPSGVLVVGKGKSALISTLLQTLEHDSQALLDLYRRPSVTLPTFWSVSWNPSSLLLSKWYSESEQNLRRQFVAARASGATVPVIVLEKLDSLLGKRGQRDGLLILHACGFHPHRLTQRFLSLLFRRDVVVAIVINAAE